MTRKKIIGQAAHKDQVEQLLRDKSAFYKSGHSASNTLLVKQKRLGLDDFDKIIDVGEDWVDVQPKVTIGSLIDTLFPLIPPVVPEFPSITVGGAIMGASLESSSFLYGQFNDCCTEYDLILGDGTLITCSDEAYNDLFWGISGSYGTLAILVRARVRLIKAKKSIHLRIEEGDPLKRFAEPPRCDFLEAVRFKERSVTLIGSFSEATPTLRLRPNSKWFYQELYEREVWMEAKDYFFRFDRGAFWMGRYLLSRKIPYLALLRRSPKSVVTKIDRDPGPLFRAFFGLYCTSNLLFRALHTIPKEMRAESFFIHDFYTPLDKVEAFLKKNALYPIWLCPVKGTGKPQILSPHFGRDFWVNIGLYGPYQESLDAFHASLGGRKMLYSSTDLDQEHFEKIYGGKHYHELRKKFSAEKNFPSLYDKLRWNHASIPRKNITSAIT